MTDMLRAADTPLGNVATRQAIMYCITPARVAAPDEILVYGRTRLIAIAKHFATLHRRATS